MLIYLSKRVLAFIPTLFLISLLAFGLSKCTPGDPVDRINQSDESLASGLAQARYYQQAYENTARQLGLNLPPFYFSFSAQAFPDTLYRFTRQDQRTVLRRLIAQYGNWPQIRRYYGQIRVLDRSLYLVPDSLRRDPYIELRSATKALFLQDRPQLIDSRLERIQSALQQDPALPPILSEPVAALQTAYESMIEEPTRYKLWIPKLSWYGWDNQYHYWASNFVTGDFGISYVDHRPVSRKIADALWWTVIINCCSLFLVFLFAIPIGTLAAARRNSTFDRLSSLLLFMLYSLPSFWIATLLVIFFTTSEYGMNIFATVGLGDVPYGASLWDRIQIRTPHLILPVFCVTYSGLAFVSRQMRGGMLEVLHEDYIRTARAKGLKHDQVIWKHAFRNALFPVITLIAGVFPSMIAGSVVIEVIFNIPGMGRLMFSSILSQDWPVVFTVLVFGALLTMLGIFIGDLLYAKADPRVGFTNAKAL